jgi:hypothetical protein
VSDPAAQSLAAEPLAAALLPFAASCHTFRGPAAEHAERDVMWLQVTAGDWIRASVLTGRMDVAQLRALPPTARPSNQFLDELERQAAAVYSPPAARAPGRQ